MSSNAVGTLIERLALKISSNPSDSLALITKELADIFLCDCYIGTWSGEKIETISHNLDEDDFKSQFSIGIIP
ncbi:MAG: hypothetical protein FWE44_02280 [Defluviitaleaceae bacterium]|nr:hypothetical protein [Defluviitaleaceae bacterium]